MKRLDLSQRPNCLQNMGVIRMAIHVGGLGPFPNKPQTPRDPCRRVHPYPRGKGGWSETVACSIDTPDRGHRSRMQ